jgi:hypothetical protein
VRDGRLAERNHHLHCAVAHLRVAVFEPVGDGSEVVCAQFLERLQKSIAHARVRVAQHRERNLHAVGVVHRLHAVRHPQACRRLARLEQVEKVVPLHQCAQRGNLLGAILACRLLDEAVRGDVVPNRAANHAANRQHEKHTNKPATHRADDSRLPKEFLPLGRGPLPPELGYNGLQCVPVEVLP